MSDSFFLDTNIIINSFDNDSPQRKKISLSLIEQALVKQAGCTSYQVTQETLNVLTGKFRKKLSADDMGLFLKEVLTPLQRVSPSSFLYQGALNIHKRWKYSFYDSLIIASALEADCQILYSEDLQHGQKIENLEIINPYVES